MSDIPGEPPAPTQEDWLLVSNKYDDLQRQLTAKTQQLEALLGKNAPAGEFPVDFAGQHNRRYAIEMSFTPGELIPQESSVTVEHGSIFRCAYVESFVRGVGTADDPYSGEEVSVQATLPWSDRLRYFDFLWKIRDTGTDREWNERPQPSLFLGGGYFGPLWLPRRIILGGGTTIFAELSPIRSVTTPIAGSFFQGGSIENYTVQVSFVGHQVPDDSEM